MAKKILTGPPGTGNVRCWRRGLVGGGLGKKVEVCTDGEAAPGQMSLGASCVRGIILRGKGILEITYFVGCFLEALCSAFY